MTDSSKNDELETNELDTLNVSTKVEDGLSINSLEAINDKTLDDLKRHEADGNEEKQQDPTITKYIEACQQGELSMVKNMVESSQVSVKDLDKDGVSGLHWASINNRLSVVKYLVSQGAEVDLRGGDLLATPLHWACRYGLVYIADYLIRVAKSNPELSDNQGFNALHLAVHSSNVMLVIYILNFTDIPVDSMDPSGRTSLHWAAYQGDTLTVDVLLKHGANVNARDTTEFTPLHWSLIRGVPELIKNLISHGSSVHDKTNDGKDCYMVATDMNCLEKLHSSLKENGFKKDGTPIKAIMTAKTAKIVTFFQPYFLLFFVLNILSFSQDWIIPKIFLAIASVIGNHLLLMKVVLPCYVHSQNPLLRTPYLAGVFSGTAFWVLVTWFTRLLPKTFDDHWFFNIIFFISSATVVSAFLKSMFINPGFIPTPAKKENIQSTIIDLIELKKFDSKNFCIYTFIRKPLRSKFSWHSKANVARFDHYCPWVFNEIGVRNHKLFATFVLALEITILLFIKLSTSQFSELHSQKVIDVNGKEVEFTCSFLSESYCKGYQQQPFNFNLLIWTCFQLVWLTFLLFVQGFQILKGLTSWEAANLHKHGIDPNGNTRNPFYSSVPSEFVENESSSTIDQSTNGTQQQQSQHQHHHQHNEPKLGCVKQWLSRSSIAKLLGLDLFVMTASDAVSMKKSFASTNYGIKRNLLDFWFISNEGEGYNLKTLFRLPIEGEANLNGKMVDYYKLWELPVKAESIV